MDQGEIAIVDCPTGKMWSDFFSKPQQGALFRTMRAQIMGCEEDYVDPLDPQPKSKQTVENRSLEAREQAAGPASAEREENRRLKAPTIGLANTRARGAWPSPQECVGRSAGKRARVRRVRWPDGASAGRSPLSESQLTNKGVGAHGVIAC